MKWIDFVFQPNGHVKDRANIEMRNNIDLSMKAETHEISGKQKWKHSCTSNTTFYHFVCSHQYNFIAYQLK